MVSLCYTIRQLFVYVRRKGLSVTRQYSPPALSLIQIQITDHCGAAHKPLIGGREMMNKYSHTTNAAAIRFTINASREADVRETHKYI